MGQINFKKTFEFSSFSEIFYYGMTRLRSTSLLVFIQCQYTISILKKNNTGENLFKRYSKFQTFDEIFYCGTNLDVFMQCQHTKTL